MSMTHGNMSMEFGNSISRSERMTKYLVMANEHILAVTDDLEDAQQRMEKFKNLMDGFGLGGTAEYYILKERE